jgi:hypothetical protein
MPARKKKANSNTEAAEAKIPINSRIRREITRLNKIFSGKSDQEKEYLNGLIKRAAFMRCQLEDMEKDLNEKGFTEMFTQSALTPPYERERPAARMYNALTKNYQVIMKQLEGFIDRTAADTTLEDGFDDFVNT